MFRDSLVSEIGLKRFGGEMADAPRECIFWTRADGQFSANLFRQSIDAFYQPHAHPEYVVTVCLEGEIVQQQWEENQVAGPGEAVISNAGITHADGYRARNSNGFEVVCLNFDPRLVASLTRELSLPTPGEGECLAFKGGLRNEILERCARGIAEELRQRGSGHKLILETLAMQLLVETLRSWPRDQVIIVAGDSTPRLPCRDFVRAYEFMRTCRKEAFRVEHLCSFLGTSEERFTRLFTASTNHTPASFYNRMLLERGREFLRDPALSIKEISYQLGFKTSSHFIVAFRREFSSAPQEYRRHSLVSHSMFS